MFKTGSSRRLRVARTTLISAQVAILCMSLLGPAFVSAADDPSADPSQSAPPTTEPSVEPTVDPSPEASLEPVVEPAPEASVEPSVEPAPIQIIEPTSAPTPEPAPVACSVTWSETLDTSKPHYRVGEIAHLTGRGYTPSCTFTLRVIDPDLQATDALVTTDAAGDFATTYTVGSTSGQHSVQVLDEDGAELIGNAFTGGPVVLLDKGDVRDGETVQISGVAFTPLTDVVVQVLRPDGSIVRTDGTPGSDTVSVDASGSFAYDYVVRDGVVEDYLVDILDQHGNSLASTSFTDSAAFVQNLGTAANGGNITSLSLIVTGTVTAGNSIIIGFSGSNASTPPVCSDSKGNSYNTDVSQVNGSGGSVSICSTHGIPAAKVLVGGVDTITLTFPGGGSGRTFSANEFSGLSADPLDQVKGGTTNNSTPTSTSTATTTQADELLFGAIWYSGTNFATFTGPGTGACTGNPTGTYTLTNPAIETGRKLATEYRIATAIGTYAACGTISTGNQTASVIATYKIAAVVVTNVAPVCADDSASVNEDGSLTDTLLCSDANVGDDLDYAMTGGPSNGTITNFVAETGAFTYEPYADFNGSDSFTFKANDGTVDSNEATFAITVDPINDAPVCQDVSITTDEDTLGSTAPDCFDVDGESLTYSVTAATTGISGTDGTTNLTYNPDGQFEGLDDTESANDSFTYKANDGTVDSAAANVAVTINGVNDAPVAVDDTDTTNEDTSLTVGAPGVLSNDTDVDGEPLSVAEVNGVGANVGVAITLPSGAILTLHANGSYTYDPNGQFEFLDTGEFATDSFTYTAFDGTALSNAATVTITINGVNDAPVANPDAYNASESTTLIVPAPGVLGNDTDVDDEPFTAVLDDDVDFGTLVLNANGSFTYLGDLGFAGIDTFTYHATDGTDPSNTTTVTITVAESDFDNDGIPDAADCTDNLFDDQVVGLSPVPPNYAGGVFTTLQAAVIAASDDDVISMYINTTENVIIGTTTGSGGKDLRIVGCGHKVTGALATKPVITVEVSAGANDGDTGAGEMDIHVDDVSVLKGSIGYLIQTSKASSNNTSTMLKSIRSDQNGPGNGTGTATVANPGIGIKVVGNGNEIRGSNSVGTNAGDGIQVIGNSNVLESNRITSNKGDGMDVAGNTNTIEANKVGDKNVGNKGNGIYVVGASNTLNENDVFANTKIGVNVTGNMNLVYKNDVGEDGKGNLGGGILITGNSNLLGKALSENSVFENTGVGIAIVGNNNLLSKNSVGDKDKGNTGDGINVRGYGNVVDQNSVFANGGDGIDSAGGTAASPNQVTNNNVGDKGKGNLGDGIVVGNAADLGNGATAPIEISGNVVRSNKLFGIRVATAGHQLASNVSGGTGTYASGGQDNGKAEFSVVAGNFNAGGNVANGAAIAGAMNSAFPATAGTP